MPKIGTPSKSAGFHTGTRHFWKGYLFLLVFLYPAAIGRAEDAPEKILAKASLTYREGIPILQLEGSPYEIGYQHGSLLRERVRQATDQMMGYFRKKLKVPILSAWIVNFMLDRSFNQLKHHIPPEYHEEMRGLAEGSGVSLRQIQRLHAVPDLFSTLCASGAFFGKATQDGRLYHLRNLDWNREIGIQDYLCLQVVRKKGKIPFVNIGYVSFIGAISGLNAEGISIGQIGSESRDETLQGTPMPLLLRRVLEESDNLDGAIRIIRDSKRTIGCNYVFADAKAPSACALETTARTFAVFQDGDPKEAGSPYALAVENAVMRSDFAVDPAVRDLQTSAGGNPKRPGLEDPRGSSAYDKRYLGQAVFVKEKFGMIDEELTKDLAAAIAPGSNVQSVIYRFPDFWVATASGAKRAVDSGFHRFNFLELLPGEPPPSLAEAELAGAGPPPRENK